MTSAERASEIVFRGIDGNECEEFIAAIEELAFTEGWSRDRERMLLFARSRLRHKALRWFARLDSSKKSDWDLFVEALFDHYPFVEVTPETATPIWSETTFSPNTPTSALPPGRALGLQRNTQDGRPTTEITTRQVVPPPGRAYDPSIPGRQLGILRVVVEDGTTGPQYVSRGRPPTYTSDMESFCLQYYDQLDATVDRREALVVCFIPSAKPHPIGCLNATNNSRELSLRYLPTNPHDYELCVMDGVTAMNGYGYYGPKKVSNVWNVLPDGSLEASLVAFDPNRRRENFKTTQVHLETSGTIRFVKPGTPLRQDDPTPSTQLARYEVMARLVFAPL